MQQKSLGQRIWEVLSPYLVYYAASVVTTFVATIIYYGTHSRELFGAITSEEALGNYIMEAANYLMRYAVEISAIAALLALPFLIAMKRKDIQKERLAGIPESRKAPFNKYGLIVGISVPMAIALNNLLILSNLAQYSEAYQEASANMYEPALLVQIVCLAIVVPITEEYIFRALIYGRMRRNMSKKKALVFSALLFGAYHGNLVQMIYGTACGLLLAYLYEKYGSIKASIFAHMLMNLVAIFMSSVNGFTWMFTKPMRMAVITVVCATLASSIFLLIQKVDEEL